MFNALPDIVSDEWLFSLEITIRRPAKKEITENTVYIKDTVRMADTGHCNSYDFTNGKLNSSRSK